MEYIDILNENGEKANYTDTRDNVHKKGLWHKAVDILVEHTEMHNKLLKILAKRY